MRLPLPRNDRNTFAAAGFTEGLWNQDVAECFLLDASSGVYTEYNLGPGGAWWAARFDGPRQRCGRQPGPEEFGVDVSTVWEADHWLARMSIPVTCAPEVVRINLTAVEATEAAGLRYYSLVRLGGETPDFHQPASWELCG